VRSINRLSSFWAAALELVMSTTALSNIVSRLERNPGVRLFNRNAQRGPDRCRLKVCGASGPCSADIRDAIGGVRSPQETPSGTLRINAFATAAREILPPLILEYLRRYPQVHIDLVIEGRLADVVAEGFHFGIRSPDLFPSDMIAVPLGTPKLRGGRDPALLREERTTPHAARPARSRVHPRAAAQRWSLPLAV
jgi:DNA-binding transcriptional LysR family regulator